MNRLRTRITPLLLAAVFANSASAALASGMKGEPVFRDGRAPAAAKQAPIVRLGPAEIGLIRVGHGGEVAVIRQALGTQTRNAVAPFALPRGNQPVLSGAEIGAIAAALIALAGIGVVALRLRHRRSVGFDHPLASAHRPT
jgi:hypothetical protein